MNNIYFFTDLDDTLIHTKRKTDLSREIVPAGYNKEGEVHSFYYKELALFIDKMISSGITFIPTTARNLDSYNRTIFSKNKLIKKVVLNFGATILINNKIDIDWQKEINNKYKEINSISEIHKKLSNLFKSEKLNSTIKIIDSYYVSIYNKDKLNNQNILQQIKLLLSSFLDNHKDFYLYENDNSFGILPNFLNKKYAVEYLINKYNPSLTFGAGDNISDLGFMNLTSFKIIPHNSTIDNLYKRKKNDE